MQQRNRVWVIVIVVLVILAIFAGVTYNSLVRKDENVKLNWGNLQNAYQRRVDLTPSLVAVVKASSDYEKQTLEQVTNARAKAMLVSVNSSGLNAENFKNQEQAQAEMVNSINKIIGVIEKYPDLKSTKSFLDLQSQLEGTERRIKVSRNDFNESVANYNKSVRGFPASLVASLLGFRPREGFQSEAGAAEAPEVKF
ncbi:MAG: LemA family protein [Chitinophagales bacterium]